MGVYKEKCKHKYISICVCEINELKFKIEAYNAQRKYIIFNMSTGLKKEKNCTQRHTEKIWEGNVYELSM